MEKSCQSRFFINGVGTFCPPVDSVINFSYLVGVLLPFELGDDGFGLCGEVEENATTLVFGVLKVIDDIFEGVDIFFFFVPTDTLGPYF